MKTKLTTALIIVLTMWSIQLPAQKTEDTKTVVYQCSVHCHSCESKIMKNISYEKGVKAVEVNLDQKLVTVAYKTSKNSDEGIQTALKKLGYQVELMGEAQTFGVNGNCNMCKEKIEKTALAVQGVSVADWNKEQKQLMVVFDAAATNVKDIQQAIAGSGYDTDLVKASDSAYEALHECCKYKRD